VTLVIDLFAGVGFGVACQRLGFEELGFDNAKAVLATREAAEMPSVGDDIASLRPSSFGTSDDILIAGPPCQPFSMASPKGKGRRALDDILQHIHFDNYTSQQSNRELAETIGDPRAGLVVEPLRWVEQVRPRLVIFEQVTTVQPIWEYALRALERMGYQGWTGILNAEQFGVPQTRRRAFLVARRDAMPGKPRPTHSRFHTRSPERLDSGVLPWVSMRDALGREEAMLSQYSTNGDPSNKGLRSPDQPSPTMTSKAGRNFWVPWGLTHRPAVTVGNAVGRGLIGGQGAKDGILKAMERGEWVDSPHGDGSNYAEKTRITHAEAGVLQTFPADFPWRGTTTEKFLTIGNAVPPLLAEVVIRSALEGQQ
jgi:DNA (cytosine-5)-methyltransferase 1